MRQEYDVTRSLVRYVALALGDEWEVREATDQGVAERPAAVIELATPEARADGSSREILEVSAGYNIFAYPVLGTEPLESRAIASSVAATLSEALESGIDEGRAGLVPLYDYEGVPWNEPSTVRRSQDFAKVLDLSVMPKQSPDDQLRFSVVAEVRLGWKRDRLLPSNARKTQSLRIGFDA